MTRFLFVAFAIAMFLFPGVTNGDVVVVDGDTNCIDTLGFNRAGVAFNSQNNTNASNVLYNGAAPTGSNITGHPIDVTLTYNNLALDNDGVFDDSVTFNINVTSPGPGLLFDQGFHNNWGTVQDMVFSITSVSGVTTGGRDIVFDGFKGASLAGGDPEGNIDRTADVNGLNYNLQGNNSGSWEFVQQVQDFALAPTLELTNSAGTSGTFVLRHMDLQFSSVPEPSSLALFGMVAGLLTFRRRR